LRGIEFNNYQNKSSGLLFTEKKFPIDVKEKSFFNSQVGDFQNTETRKIPKRRAKDNIVSDDFKKLE